MLKPSLINIPLFWFVKYLIFYVFLMFKSGNYQLLEVDTLKNGEDWFYYLWLLLFMPVLTVLVLSAPLYFSFKVNRSAYFLLIVITVLLVEYFAYTYLASPSDLTNGIYNGIISILFLLLFFYKPIKLLFSPASTA